MDSVARSPLPRFEVLESEYEVLRELGRGGTAVVYLARERELDRMVAIKVIRSSHVEDEEAVARLVREARTVARLQHPAIVMLHGTRRLGDGSIALIMQYVPGRTLKSLIRRIGPLPADIAERILHDIGGALAYAHHQRVVHRDIKPENIYIDQESGIARLSDFGIARPWDTESTLTVAGMALGTPAYMSPEQIDGKELDGRSDLYSLGLVGYEMLTAQQPWAGHNLYGVIYRQKHADLPPLAERRPDVPLRLRAAIEGCLAKDRERRWATGDVFLEQLGMGEPGSATAEGVVEVPLPEPGESAEPVAEVREAYADALTIRYRRDEAEALEDSPAPEVAEAEAVLTDQPPPPAPLPAVPAPPAESGEEAPKARTGRRRFLAAVTILLVVGAGSVAALAVIHGQNEPAAALGAAAEDSSASGAADAAGVVLPPPEVREQPSAAATAAAARFTIAGGAEQTGLVATPLPDPLTVLVVDSAGEPLRDVTVTFGITAGNGTVRPQSTTTNGKGIASAVWLLGRRAGANSVVARVGRRSGLTVTFTAMGEAGPPATMMAVGAADHTVSPGTPLPDSLVVQVEDEWGNPLADQPVAFRVAAGDARIDTPVQRTDESGRASVHWTPGAGDNQVVASITGTAVQTTFTTRAAAPAPAIRPTIVAGGTHSCATNSDGFTVCWGANSRGQLGDGTEDREATPVSVAGGIRFVTLAAGIGHTCGVAAGGAAYCWGSNDSGQLGDGSTTDRLAPTKVVGDLRFSAITAGVSHTCGLTRGGQAMCWGGNGNGQLGDGSRSDRAYPAQVSGNLTFRAIAAGWEHTCALSRNGRIFCWGRNDFGELGNGGGASAPTPQAVSGDLTFAALAAGSAHSCSITTDGAAYCWGQNTYGQLGDGGTTNRASPVAVEGGRTFRSIIAGSVHTCALTPTGEAYCWGRNTYGQLGDGSIVDRATPVRVAGGLTFAALYASGAHTCGVTRAGADYCWGYNVEGQLGDGTRTDRTMPVRVRGR